MKANEHKRLELDKYPAALSRAYAALASELDAAGYAAAEVETIENNVRRLIVKESQVDPAYYEKMSKLLDALIAQRHKGVIDYRE